MTTQKLTHEQAALLRSVNAHVVIYIGGPIIGDWDASAYIEEYCVSAPAELTPSGREALAEYNREHRTVLTSDLAMAVDGLEHEIREYEARWDGYLDRIADYDEEREALDRLRAALEGK